MEQRSFYTGLDLKPYSKRIYDEYTELITSILKYLEREFKRISRKKTGHILDFSTKEVESQLNRFSAIRAFFELHEHTLRDLQDSIHQAESEEDISEIIRSLNYKIHPYLTKIRSANASLKAMQPNRLSGQQQGKGQVNRLDHISRQLDRLEEIKKQLGRVTRLQSTLASEIMAVLWRIQTQIAKKATKAVTHIESRTKIAQKMGNIGEYIKGKSQQKYGRAKQYATGIKRKTGQILSEYGRGIKRKFDQSAEKIVKRAKIIVSKDIPRHIYRLSDQARKRLAEKYTKAVDERIRVEIGILQRALPILIQKDPVGNKQVIDNVRKRLRSLRAQQKAAQTAGARAIVRERLRQLVEEAQQRATHARA